MSLPKPRLTYCAIALLLSLIAVAPLSGSASQNDERNSYTSPTFGYEFSWDPESWEEFDRSSEDGYDFLALESADSAVFVEGLSFYQGDRDLCLDGERQRIAEDSGFSEIAPLLDVDGEPLVGAGDDYVYGLFDVPASADGEYLASVVYVECRTLVADSSVLIITAFVDPATADSQLDNVYELADSITVSGAATSAFDPATVEQISRAAANDANALWETVFAELGVDYITPNLIAVTGPTETECGDAYPGETGSFYCPADLSIYIDVPDSIDNDLGYGVTFFQVVIAHEVAHHAQELLQLSGCTDPTCGEPWSSLAIELQADCFAGYWMQDSAANGEIDEMELGRVEVAVVTFLGDPIDVPTDDPDAHGTGEQRFALFMSGYNQGLAACGLQI